MAVDASTTPELSAKIEPESATPEADLDEVGADGGDAGAGGHRRRLKRLNVFAAAGLALVVAIGGLAGYLGYQAFRTDQGQVRQQQFVQAGRQAALDLTTIDYAEVDADVKRIVDSSVGSFRDDFTTRAPDFVQVVKQVQSKSQGTVSDVGLESMDGDRAQVLVAVSVVTTTPTDANSQQKSWRMRISLDMTHDGPRVSNVEFVT